MQEISLKNFKKVNGFNSFNRIMGEKLIERKERRHFYEKNSSISGNGYGNGNANGNVNSDTNDNSDVNAAANTTGNAGEN